MSEDNIFEEYKELFGIHVYDNLYSPDDESYGALRREIMDAPQETYNKSVLPFEGVSLISYEQYKEIKGKKRLNDLANILQMLLFHKIKEFSPIFHISDDMIRAFGYFDPKTKSFHIFSGSTVASLDLLKYSTITLSIRRQRFLAETCRKEKKVYRVMKDVCCDSAEIAAFYVLGREVSENVWKDENGRNFRSYFPNMHLKKNVTRTISSLKENVNSKKIETHATSSLKEVRPIAKSSQINQHIFYIKKKVSRVRFCDAKGYYIPSKNHFILKAGSIMTLDSADSYSNSTAGIMRVSFIKENCKKLGMAYQLNRDITFASPSGAAALCLGRSANGWNEWKDKNGATLRDMYKKE